MKKINNEQQPKSWGDTIRESRRNTGLIGSGVGVLGGLASGGSLKARLAKGAIAGVVGNIVASPIGDSLGRVRASTRNLKNYENPNERNVARQGRRGLMGGALLGAGLYAANAKSPKLGKMLRTGLAAGAVGSMVGATGGRIYNRATKKKEDNAKYSLFQTPYSAEFGVMNYIKHRAQEDLKKVVDAGVKSEQTDDVVKRLLKSGEKAGKQRAKVYGRYARKVWNTSPKLRRNVKIAGVAGAGLVGLNALTGLKTVYDIGTGVKNKLTGKKREYSMFLGDIAHFAQNTTEQPKKKSLLKKALKYGVIGGVGLAGLAGATRYGGAALKYRKAKNFYNGGWQKGAEKSMDELSKISKNYHTGGAKGLLQRDIERLRGKKPIFINLD